MTRHVGANSELLTIKDVARELGVGYRLAQTAINTGQIPSVVIGKCRMVSRTALDRWLLLGQPVVASGEDQFSDDGPWPSPSST